MNENLRRAVEALHSGAQDLHDLSVYPASQIRTRLRRTAEEILTHLEAEDDEQPDEEDIISALDRQSKEIAEDLRRVDELMKRRLGRQ